jgi:hypothetical protein
MNPLDPPLLGGGSREREGRLSGVRGGGVENKGWFPIIMYGNQLEWKIALLPWLRAISYFYTYKLW